MICNSVFLGLNLIGDSIPLSLTSKNLSSIAAHEVLLFGDIDIDYLCLIPIGEVKIVPASDYSLGDIIPVNGGPV